MATPQQIRAALSEIPLRLDRLRVASSPTTEPDEPEPTTNVLNVTLPDAWNNISYTDLSSSAPSPDELVIRQKGRRRITLSWSPVKCPVSSRHPFPRTPVKSTTTMTLRSSPRKRLLPSEQSTPEKCPALASGRVSEPFMKANTVASPSIKRLRLEEKPIAQRNLTTPLHVMLKGLSQDQLVGIIKNLIKDDPVIEERIRNEIPLPDISPMQNELMQIKRNIFKSLPASRLIKKTDSAAYSRVVIHLTGFKKLIESQAKLLYDSQHWDALLDYVAMAWNYAKGTPIWDNNSHNTIRRQCFKILAWHCAASLRFGGKLLGQTRLLDFQRSIREMRKDFSEISSSFEQINRILEEF